jgi:hypothetical protein
VGEAIFYLPKQVFRLRELFFTMIEPIAAIYQEMVTIVEPIE